MTELGLTRRGVLAAAGIGAAATAGSMIPGTAHAGPPSGGPPGRRVVPGADRAHADRWRVFEGRRIGVITNPTGIVQDGMRSIVDAMHETGIEIGAVFGPEHGFRGTAQAGESEGTTVDERTGITVYDAYGTTDKELTEFFTKAKIDTVVFDIQDVGARFYTYIWTMYHAMIAAIHTDVEFWVLDRPNPVGGAVRGGLLRPGFESGIGLDEIPQAHGMTAGEIARWFNGELMERAAGGTLDEVHVVEVARWHRNTLFADTGLRWTLPSPNMPTPSTALLYPGTGMFEATNLSEGRGTTRPFEIIGAPFIDHHWAADLNSLELPGVVFREMYFVPTFSKWETETCGGVQVHINDSEVFDPLAVATHMMVTGRDRYPEFDWRGHGGRWIDLMTGSDRFRTQFEDGASAEEIIAGWEYEVNSFTTRRRPYLLYR